MNEKTNLYEERESWETIIDDFKKARYCLCCPKHTNNWKRNEKDGYYYLLKAYCNLRSPTATGAVVNGHSAVRQRPV